MERFNLKSLQQEVTSLRAQGKYRETIESCYNLLNLGMQQQDDKSVLIAHLNAAASYYCIGDIEEAFRSIGAYDEVCSIHGDEIDDLNRYNVLFLLHEYSKDSSKAKSTLDSAIHLGTKLQKYNIVSNAFSNYSHLYLEERNYADALEMAKKGLEIAKLHQPRSTILEVRVKLNIAEAYIGLSEFDESKRVIEDIENELVTDSYPRELAQFNVLRNSWFSSQGRYREALEALTHARDLVKSYHDIYLLEVIQKERCRLCELLHDTEAGFVAQKEYISVLEEVRNRELEITALKLEVKHSLSDLQRRATTDHLTGLPNRHHLETTVNEWLREASHSAENIVCIAIDVDNFKEVNDESGHLLGDTVIRAVGKACASVIRGEDIIGRYGGDEFVAILRGASMEAGKRKAEQMAEAVRTLTITHEDIPSDVTISMGIADNAAGTLLRFHELFQLADTELYRAKRSGKNRICIRSFTDKPNLKI